MPPFSGTSQERALVKGLASAKAILSSLSCIEALTVGTAIGRSTKRGDTGARLNDSSSTDLRWMRTEAVAILAPHLSGRLLERAFQGVQVIEDGAACDDALTALASHLPIDLRRPIIGRRLAMVAEIQHERIRAEAIRTLAPRLTGEHLEQALAATLSMSEPFLRAHTLGVLVPLLPLEVGEPGAVSRLGSRLGC